MDHDAILDDIRADEAREPYASIAGISTVGTVGMLAACLCEFGVDSDAIVRFARRLGEGIAGIDGRPRLDTPFGPATVAVTDATITLLVSDDEVASRDTTPEALRADLETLLASPRG
jgi:hypothetical protein